MTLRVTSLHLHSRQIPDVSPALHEPEGLDVDVVVAHHHHESAADAHRAGREVADTDVVRAALEFAGANDFRSEALRDVFVEREAGLGVFVAVETLLA